MNRIGVAVSEALFAAVDQQILQHCYLARGGQIIDATLVPALKQHFTREDKEQIKEKAMPADWSPAKRRQKDLEATWTKKHGEKQPWLQALCLCGSQTQTHPQMDDGYG